LYEGLRILYVGKRFQNNEDIRELIKSNMEYISVIRELFDEILENNDSNILNKNYDIKGIKFQKGQSIFRIYVSLQKKLETLQKEIKSDKLLPDLDSINEFKEFSQININTNQKYYLVFSTKQSDICGIGSRGILSCQNLFNEFEDYDYHEQLIGSILSRYVGTCYITSGSDYKNRGEKMIFRVLIRLIINGQTNQPEILIDRLYPNNNYDIIQIIKRELSKKVNLPIKYDVKIDDYYIKDEPYIPTENMSYTDTVQTKYSLKRTKELVHSSNQADRIKAIEKGELKDVIELADDLEPNVKGKLFEQILKKDKTYQYGNILKKIIENEFERDYFGFYLNKIYYELTDEDLKFIKTLDIETQRKILFYMKNMDKDKYDQIFNYLKISINSAEHTGT
jgi:hypothetical protein